MLADKEDMPQGEMSAKMKALSELREMIEAMMEEGDMEQVTVAASDSEGLEQGLGKAQEMLSMMPKEDDEDEEDEEKMY